MKVSLKSIVDELSSLPPDFIAYLDRRTGTILSFSEDDLQLAGDESRDLGAIPEWQRELVEHARRVLDEEQFVPLPERGGIDEYRLIEGYCGSREEPELRRHLLQLIRGRGAICRFKDAVHAYGLREEWYDYRYAGYASIATEWLEANGIEWEADLQREDA